MNIFNTILLLLVLYSMKLVQGANQKIYEAPSRFSVTSILSLVMLLVVICILLYLFFKLKEKKNKKGNKNI